MHAAGNFLPSSDEHTIEVADLRTGASAGSGRSPVTRSPLKADQDDMTQHPSTHRGLSVGVGFYDLSQSNCLLKPAGLS